MSEPLILDRSLFQTHDLGDGCQLLTGKLPADQVWTTEQFEAVWAQRPAERDTIMMYGRPVEIPRLQQGFEKPYRFSGKTMLPEPATPEILLALLRWVQANVFAGLNGILNNYYEGPDEYIGPHCDSIADMIEEAPIVTVSFGETRPFRLTRREGKTVVATRAFEAAHGTVIVMPYRTNRLWYHEVPQWASHQGRRISVTVRAFH